MTRRATVVGVAAIGAIAVYVWWSGSAAVPGVGSGPMPEVEAHVTHLAIAGRASATPSIATAGRAVAIAWSAADPAGGADIYAAVSTDEGRTFGVPVRVNDEAGTARVSGEMPPRVAVAAPDGLPLAVHVLWTARNPATSIRLATSKDGGRTFGPSQPLQSGAATGDRGWAALDLDGSGRVHAVWLDHRGKAADAAAGAPSHHHGHDAVATRSSEEGVAMAQQSGLYYSDGVAERELTTGVCYCCKTAVVASGAGAEPGRLALAWRHVYAGNLRDIAFMSSDDNGRTFSPVARVSEDQWRLDGCPDDGPAMAADASGTLHLVWPTVVSQPTPHKAMFYASSTDARTFSPRVRVSPVGRNIAHPQIAVNAAGEVAVVWDEPVEGRRRVYLSRRESGVGFADAAVLDNDAAALYPVIAFAERALVVAWTESGAAESRIAVRSMGSAAAR